MLIGAIDPGTSQSAIVDLRSDLTVADKAILPNEELVHHLDSASEYDVIVCEMVASYGMPVGAEVFSTCVWVGRFWQAARADFRTLTRGEVKMSLCQTMRAKDANVRQAVIDMYRQTGGGRVPQIGTKADPGPLYGVRSHMWSALAVGIAYYNARR